MALFEGCRGREGERLQGRIDQVRGRPYFQTDSVFIDPWNRGRLACRLTLT